MKCYKVIGLNQRTLMTPYFPPIDEQSWILDSTDSKGGLWIGRDTTQCIWATSVHMPGEYKTIIVLGALWKGKYICVCAEIPQIAGPQTKVRVCAKFILLRTPRWVSLDSFCDMFIFLGDAVVKVTLAKCMCCVVAIKWERHPAQWWKELI